MSAAITIDTSRSRTGLLLAGGLGVGAVLALVLFVFFDPINLFAFGLQKDLVGTVEIATFGIGVALSFVSGATMVFTPCGLPLIVTMNTIAVEGRKNGRSWVPPMALFTLGIVATMAIWGAAAAFAGGSLLRLVTPSGGSMRTTITIYVGLGVLMLVMALWEFRIIDLPRPARRSMPRSLNRFGPYPKSLGMGAALGGGFGIGCPFPTYQAVLAWVVIVGNPWYGAIILGANALGRALPLWPIGAIAYGGGDQRGISRWLLGNTRRSRLISGTGLAVFAGMMIVLWGLLIPIGRICLMEFIADVQVLSTPGCAGCDDVKRVVAAALAHHPGFTWEEIDLVEHPGVAVRFGIMTVPAVVMGGNVVFTGVSRHGRLEAAIEARLGKDAT